MSAAATVAGVIAESLAHRGVKRIFGIPGGGSSLDLIDACADQGIDYVLTHTETAAVIMAAVTAELSGAPGAVSTGLGPGAAAAANGVAYAALDRAPVLVVTDSYRPGQHDFVTHQKFDHGALFMPITKARDRARPEDAGEIIDRLLDIAMTPPHGPVHLDMSAADAGAETPPLAQPETPRPDPVLGKVDAARTLLDSALKPVIIAGLQARTPAAAEAARALARHLACPVATTYKAKGVFPDDDPRYCGLFTGGSMEAPWLHDADLIIMYGLDPVELIASPWPYQAPVVELATAEVRPHYTVPAASLFGPLEAIASALDGAGRPTNWQAAVTRDENAAIGNGALTAATVAVAAADKAPAGARATVDAGAHMLPVMPAWRAQAPNDLLISNGLSTMGFAVPAAIAAALETPERPVVAFTGDGGLAMCLAELATAARHDLPVIVLVFNDAALSMIDLKQQQRGFSSRGVRYPALDFRSAAEAMGCAAARAEDAGDLEAALIRAFHHRGPSLIDITIDPAPYRAALERIRGVPQAPAGRA